MEINSQIFESKDSFGFTINEIDIKEAFELSMLLSSDLIDHQIRPEFVKERLVATNDQNGYLKGLFCSDELSHHDFKYFQENGIYYYLDGFSESEEEWGEDKLEFKSLLESFKQKTESSLGSCYLINKEWFNESSGKVRSREFALYDYYFLIIWLDKNDTSKLYLSEWFSD